MNRFQAPNVGGNSNFPQLPQLSYGTLLHRIELLRAQMKTTATILRFPVPPKEAEAASRLPLETVEPVPVSFLLRDPALKARVAEMLAEMNRGKTPDHPEWWTLTELAESIFEHVMRDDAEAHKH